MTTTGTHLPTATAGVSPTGILAPARWLLVRQLDTMRWFIGLVCLVFAIAYPLIGAAGDELPVSIWESFAANGPSWFLLAMGATAVSSYLPFLVANGVPRARFTYAAGLALAGGALVLALVIALGFTYEGVMMQRFGWQDHIMGDHLFTSRSQVLLVIGEYFVRYLLFGVVGLIAGYGFYRTGGWWGTVLLPLTVLVPLGLGFPLIGQSFELIELARASGLGGMTGTGAWLALLYIAGLLGISRLLLGTVPIRTKAG